MKLDQWLDAERGRMSLMAKHFGVTVSAVSQWKSGVPPAQMKAVRDFTEGAVTLEDMVPDPKIAEPQPSRECPPTPAETTQ
jgi:DNA-binding transcriptional regulator YdaS (Cro superfamily)